MKSRLISGSLFVLALTLLVISLALAQPPEPTPFAVRGHTSAPEAQPEHIRLENPLEPLPTTSGQIAPAAGGWMNIMSEDFEGSFPGTTWVRYGDPVWGKESYRPHSGSWSGYCAGEGVGAVDPPGPYPHHMTAWMIYGPFDLSEASKAEVLFYRWNKLEGTNDKFFWGASVNGTDFYGTSTRGNSDGWKHVGFDLTNVHALGDLTGQAEVWIAFYFESDSSIADEGVYIDDILLRAGSGAEVYMPLVLRPGIVSSVVSAVIRTDEEGTVEHPDGASIYVPPGAVPLNLSGGEGEMLFTIEHGSAQYFGAPTQPPTGTRFASDIFSMGPEGFTFQEPIELTIPLYSGIEPQDGQVIMTDYDPDTSQWLSSGGRVDWNTRTFKTDAMHLCINRLFVIDTGEAWGALRFDEWDDYGFYACVQEYSQTYPPVVVSWRAVDNYVRIYPGNSTTFWLLPQGTYTLQIAVYRRSGERLGYFERAVTINEPYVYPSYSATEVPLQTDNLIPGRPQCLGTPTPSLGVGAVNVRLDWRANADLDLWVEDPCGNLIFYPVYARQATCQASLGQLDQDNQCSGLTLGAPENIFWAANPPRGNYKVYADYYEPCGGSGADVNYTVQWWVDGNVYTKHGTISPPAYPGADGDEILVTQFTY